MACESDDATPGEIQAVVREVCRLPNITADAAVAMDDQVLALLDVVEGLGPILLEHGAEAVERLVRDRSAHPQTAKEACELVRTLGRMAGEYRGRYGRQGEPLQSSGGQV